MKPDDNPEGRDIEDIQLCARAGRPPRAHGPYKIMVGDGALNFVPVILEEPVPTGRQILVGAGKLPEDEHALLMMLHDGALEAIRLDEPSDLRTPGVELFLAFRTDRLLRLFVDNREFNWGAPRISGRTLKLLAGIAPDTHDVFLKGPGGDELVHDMDLIDLDRPSTEHFATSGIHLTVIVNAELKEVHKRRLTFKEVVLLAFPDASFAPNMAWTVTYSRGPMQNPKGDMVDGQALVLQERMVINVRCTDQS